MISRIDRSEEAGPTESPPADRAASRPRFPSVVLLSTWCGLVAGLLEVGSIVLRKRVFDENHLYDMSRHFTWVIPLTNLCIVLALGVLGWIAGLAWPRRSRRLLGPGLCTLTLLPMALVALPQIYGLACLVLAMGAASRIVPWIERGPGPFRRFVRASFPAVLGVVAILAASPWVGDRIRQSRERARPLPPPGSPNILLIVMDTVAAGHSSLCGYERATSTTLVELAERGIRFDAARAASSWTLPSHATIFTGRWLHELSVGWLNPLDATHPTLAESLGARGYATAGFVANVRYCAGDSGLGRGFTVYRDYIFPGLTALKMPILVNRALVGLQPALEFLVDRPGFAWLRPAVNESWRLLVDDRKAAAVVNRELLDWLSRRPGPGRPFFAFLNYFDAHRPYRLPPGRIHRFGVTPTGSQRQLIQNWGDLDKTRLSAEEIAFVAAAYDDCIADLDEQIGKLLDELRRRGDLDRTWLIITSDHGESFGEHAGVFGHGTSLYQTELHVPLLIVPPGGAATAQVIRETVSLRDLAATIVDVLGLEDGSPLPGDSLARYWDKTSLKAAARDVSSAPALAEVVPDDPLHHDSLGLPPKTWPLGALHAGGWKYIRREGDLREELFDLRADPGERRDRAGDPAARERLERMRAALDRLTGGPLSPQRFNR
jgi:arylsulfatase A-like enzyme